MSDLKDYLTSKAEEFAKKMAEKPDKRNPVLEKHQLRKFYDDLKLIERKINEQNNDEEKFKNEYLPLIYFVKSKIAYSAGRESGVKQLVPKYFAEYMFDEIDKINSIKEFKVFIMHYQAIIGYYTFYVAYPDTKSSQQPVENRGRNR